VKASLFFRSRRRGFTLVELMVAITGGLFVAIIVFIISRNTARFYKTETRIGEATLGAVVGFERLRTDLARAGFLASPNIMRDPKVCAGPATAANWPVLLGALASVRIFRDDTLITTLQANGITPDRILLAGSYASVDQFPMTTITDDAGGGWRIALQPEAGPMARIGYGAAPDKNAKMAVLASVFGTGRGLRIVDHGGMQFYGTIAGVDVTDPGFTPEIVLGPAPVVEVAGSGICSLPTNCVGCQVNVINFVQYDVRNLKDSPNLPSPNPYGPLYDDAGAAPFDGDRSELARVELNVDGEAIIGTEEIVTEHAVDLKFGLTVDNRAGSAEPTLTTFLPDNALIDNWAGDIGGATPAKPERIRGIRVRMSVRSAEPDREANIDPAAAGVAPGLYRIGLGSGGGAPFARVRTLQSDVALHNTTGVPW
jgi:hypothetical protein